VLGVGAVAVAVAVVAAVITALSGPGSTPRSASVPGTAPPGGTPTIPAPQPVDPDAAALNNLVIAQSDVSSAYVVGLIPGGSEVVGQTTLDLCNGTYPSERLRTARRQVVVEDAQGANVISTEAVLYRNAAATAQAFGELRARAANCPQTFLPPAPGESGAPSKTTFKPAPDASWPQVAGVQRQAYDFTTTDEQGNASESVAVYLRRGRALLGVYFSNPGQPQPAVAGQTTVAGIVDVLAKRMAALPASVVDGTGPAQPSGGTS
jgi:hypothetical protein